MCSEHFSECDFANPMEYRMLIEADTLFWYSFKILPDRLKLIWLYPCQLVGLSGKVSVLSSELELAILQRLPRVT